MRGAVLAHERAHIARHDFAMLLAAQLNQAVFWFSPLSWWLHHHLAALAELASDDDAMASTGDRPAYAEILLEMARRSGPLFRGLAMARPATLVGRIERILSDRVPTHPVGLLPQAILVFGAASLSILAASSHPSRAPSPAPLLTAGQGTLIASADPDPPPTVPHVPAPSLVPQLTQSGTPEIPASAPSPASPASPTTRPVQLAKKPLLPPRLTPQRVKTGQDQPPLATHTTVPPRPPNALPLILQAAFKPGSDGQLVPRTQPLVTPAPPVAELLPARRNEPSCTGTYLPKPDAPRNDGPVEIIHTSYFQTPDGTPWLKLFLGVRTRATLTGFPVERTTIRTTVLTTLPKGLSHLTGRTQGPYGSIDFECIGANTHL